MRINPHGIPGILVAVFAAFAASVREFGVLAASRMAFNMVRDVTAAALFSWHRSSRELRKKRAIACVRCHRFSHRYGTCGRPGDVDVHGEKIGCWCHYRVAGFVKSKQCWDGEQFGDWSDKWK